MKMLFLILNNLLKQRQLIILIKQEKILNSSLITPVKLLQTFIHLKMTSERSKRRDFLSVIFTSKSISELQTEFQNRVLFLFLCQFLYDTFPVEENHDNDPPNNARKLNRCYLEVGNGIEYPPSHFSPCSAVPDYRPSSDVSRVFRDVMSY
ncbi:unnamed protein product, partial [Porites evermanni]